MNVPPPNLPTAEPPLYIGRISRNTFEPLIGVFYGLAIIAAFSRLALQLRTYGRLHVDDYFLIFACICITVSTTLGYVNVGILYWNQKLVFNPAHFIYLLKENVDIGAHINAYERLSLSYPVFVWAAIFAVKLAYLAFFRHLVDRVRPLLNYWRIILCFSVISFLVYLTSIFVTCPKWGLEAMICLRPAYMHRSLDLIIVDVVLDIITDLMIVSIPVCLLWSVRINKRQKFIIGIFLSLNLFMTLTAAARASGLSFHGKLDIIWLYVWQQIEACVAVMMISITAFRSVFVITESAHARKELANKLRYSSMVAAINRKRVLDRRDEESIPGLPTIPSATLTGVRTFIQEERHPGIGLRIIDPTATSELEPEQSLLHERPAVVENSTGAI